MMCASKNIKEKPIAVFGVLTDVQYADADDRACNSSKTRFYKGSLKHVDEAFNYWENHDVKFVLQLGDIIDGLNRIKNESREGLSRTLTHFEQHSTIPTFHTVGNHELYNFSRKELALLFYQSVMKIQIPDEIFQPVNPKENDVLIFPELYYRFSPVPGLKCISLDCFDISVLGYPPHHPKYLEAAEVLSSKHGHDVFEDWDGSGSLRGLDVRFQQMNGAIGPEQLLWLEKELEESDESLQKVIVYGHVSLHPDSSDWSCLLWNYEEVMEVFHRHRCVVAYFNGHTHESGSAVDSHGISYICLAGMLECPPDQTAFATVSVFSDRLEVEGHGIERSHAVPLETRNGMEGTIAEGKLKAPANTVKVEV